MNGVFMFIHHFLPIETSGCTEAYFFIFSVIRIFTIVNISIIILFKFKSYRV